VRETDEANNKTFRTPLMFWNASKKSQTRATKIKSEHHKVSENSSANAQRMRATNLPCHRQSRDLRKQNFRIAGGKLSAHLSADRPSRERTLGEKKHAVL
jgi:hypothetical protein